MKPIAKLLTITVSAVVLVLSSACEQQSASVVHPKYYAEKKAKEQAKVQDPSNPNPPTYFGN